MASSLPYKPQPVNQVAQSLKSPTLGFKLVQKILTEMDRVLRGLFAPPGSGGGGGGGGSGLATRDRIVWCANGPYRVDTQVDGMRTFQTPMTISSVWLSRTTPGTSGQTVVDLNLDGSTMYTTQANRPTITPSDTQVLCILPDVTTIPAGSSVWLDTDERETGIPQGWSLIIEGA